jgi:hypothetical protein
MGIRTRRQVMERDRKKDLIMKFLGGYTHGKYIAFDRYEIKVNNHA